MIGYTSVGTNDLDRAVHFYGELLALLGAKPFFKTDRGIGWGVSPDKPMFSVLKPYDGQPATKAHPARAAMGFMALTFVTSTATSWRRIAWSSPEA